jgi:hypothetical protein
MTQAQSLVPITDYHQNRLNPRLLDDDELLSVVNGYSTMGSGTGEDRRGV